MRARRMFGFETWHSAAELRRYLLRFLRLFPDLETMPIIQSTRDCGHDSIVRPMVRWLEAQGARSESGVQVTDLQLEPSDSGNAVRRIEALRHGEPFGIDVGPRDLVIVTLGSRWSTRTARSLTTWCTRSSTRCTRHAWPCAHGWD